MIVVACALPLRTFLELSGTSLPYQDPTPDMVAEQAARIAALERALVFDLSIATLSASLGALAITYGLRRRRRRGAAPDTRTAGDRAADPS